MTNIKKYKKIKFNMRYDKANEYSIYRAQTPHNSGIWNNCQFIFNPSEKEYDWLVILDDMPKILPKQTEYLKCPQENTIFVTSEPSSITYYGKAFVKQFHYLLTNHSAKRLPHPNAIRSQTGIYWMYGKEFDNIIKDNFILKRKKISTICSDKRQGHTMHKKRYDFTALMEKKIPELERFGKGFHFIEKKYEAIDDYKFHVVIENHIEKEMWSEKLADAFLGFSVPIYCGCPNIYDYFPKDSLIVININKPEAAIQKIKEVINTPGEYERRFEAVKEARKRIIYDYNLVSMICNIVNKADKYSFIPNKKIKGRRYMRVTHIYDLFGFFSFRINNFFKSIKSQFLNF